ncbi:MAG TPA: radical SAM protein [Magnetospirillum sp.]|nr:radical SAM protein [Magnetospirillum sp.]
MQNQATLKANLLSHGVAISDAFRRTYAKPFLGKRRAYGNTDPLDYLGEYVPQEFYLLPSRTIVAANIRPNSPWTLDHDGDFILRGPEGARVQVTFPRHPAFYDYTLRNGLPVSRVITLYGGGSLGLFVYGNCALVDLDKPCQYCSIKPNHQKGVDFEKVLSPDLVEEAISLALSDLDCPISQVMINGGNFPDLDKNFLHYAKVVAAARRAIDRSGRSVDLHLIVFPPKDLELFHELAPLDVCVAINTEVFNPELFATYSPGKHAVAGQDHIQGALVRAVEILGPGRVYSILVGGLETLDFMEAGMRRMAAKGVTPVVNIFHADPETPLAEHPAPSAEAILAMGKLLQTVYSEHDFMRPFYMDCGRNAIDTEAFRRQFA